MARDPYGFGNTGWTRLRRRSSASPVSDVTSSSSNITRPDVGGNSPGTMLATVDFPDPDSPTIAVVVPRRIRKDTSSTGGTRVDSHGTVSRTLETLVSDSATTTSGLQSSHMKLILTTRHSIPRSGVTPDTDEYPVTTLTYIGQVASAVTIPAVREI